jgi:cytochrome b561
VVVTVKSLIILVIFLIAPVVSVIALQSGVLVSLTQLLQILLFAWPATLVLGWIIFSLIARIGVNRRPGLRPWNPLSKIFHWVMALSILSTTALMYYMVNIGDLTVEVYRAEYSRLLKTHKSLGLLVLFLVLLRFAWNRWKPRPPLPDGMSAAQITASKASHHFLYLAMFIVPLLGWMASMTYGGRTFFFGLFEMPVWLPKNIEWANILQPAHIWLAWGMLAVVGIHTLAALWHHFVKKDATLAQMLPDTGRRRR